MKNIEKIDLMKIDAEKSEDKVLEGGAKTLSRGIAPRIICEIHSTRKQANVGQDKIRKVFLVNLTNKENIKYYIREVFPTHGQPAGTDTASLLFSPPVGEEYVACASWVQNSPDELPDVLFGVINQINISAWYEAPNIPMMGIQRYQTYSTTMDLQQDVPPVEDKFAFSTANFSVNWPITHEHNWYYIAVKLFDNNVGVQWGINSKNMLSYVDIGYTTTATPLIKKISNENITLISATSSDNLKEAEIILDGIGKTDFVVEMSVENSYSVYMDDILCDNSDCNYVMNGKEITISSNLEGEHIIEITSKTIVEPDDCTENTACLTGEICSIDGECVVVLTKESLYNYMGLNEDAVPLQFIDPIVGMFKAIMDTTKGGNNQEPRLYVGVNYCDWGYKFNGVVCTEL